MIFETCGGPYAKLPGNIGGCTKMKPTADLEARIMNRLQTMNRGQTIEQFPNRVLQMLIMFGGAGALSREGRF